LLPERALASPDALGPERELVLSAGNAEKRSVARLTDRPQQGGATQQGKPIPQPACRPAAIYPDPIRGGDDVLVLCSVYNPDDTPHVTNTRAMLENMLTPAMLAEKPLYGFEQARWPRPLPGVRRPGDVIGGQGGCSKVCSPHTAVSIAPPLPAERRTICKSGSLVWLLDAQDRRRAVVSRTAGELPAPAQSRRRDMTAAAGRAGAHDAAGKCSKQANRRDPDPNPRRPRAQEYTMLEKGGNVHGWPMGGFPAPQGPFYCGVGSESVYGRPLAEAHMDACIRVRAPGPRRLHVPAVHGVMTASRIRRAACVAALPGSALLHRAARRARP
jgi:hypothetical protein